RLYGGNGNDTILTGSGVDVAYGGEGDDVINGGGFWGDTGRKTMYGGGGGDTLYGSTGDDLLFGEDGDDHIFGLGGNDLLDGGAGDDGLWGHTGNEVFRGGAGNDTFSYLIGSNFGNDVIVDFQRGSDDIFLFGNFANGNLDTNRDGLLDAADDTVDISSGSMVIDLGLGSGSIAGIDSLTVIGITSLDVQDSGLIILT